MAITRIKNFKSFQCLTLIISALSALGLLAQENATNNISEPILVQSPLVTQAYKLLELGASAGALNYFQQALTENDRNLSALLGQAMILTDLGRHAEAFATYDNIVANYPHHAFAWNGAAWPHSTWRTSILL